MAINKAMKAALKVLSYPDPDIKKSYKLVRKLEKATSKRVSNPKICEIRNVAVARDGFDIPVRIFSVKNGKPKGVILFFHGGGWVNGDIDSYTGVCIRMVEELSRTVVSVDYRRAPEYKFPNATEDCYEVARQLFAGLLLPEFFPNDICIMGDSAGGNLAAAVSLMARDRGEFLPKRQILIYPATGNDHTPDSPFESVKSNGSDYLLTSKRIVGYMELYISSKDDLQNPYLAPLLEEDLSNQPKTLIITAEFCPLRDEGEEYGRRLSDAGNSVLVYRMPDALHGYFSLPLKMRKIRKTFSVIRSFLGDDRLADNHASDWIRLDNAAKIFPPTTSKRDEKVFRFFCQLNEAVDSRVLQSSLDFTVERFPFYRSVLKKGIFWYYFEGSSLSPVVREEYREPCSRIYNSNRKSLLFEVTYYRNRINFEVYHALADGEGALRFFQTLISCYLKKCHAKEIPVMPQVAYDASETEKKDDSFFRYYSKRKIPHAEKMVRAYRLSGEQLDTHPLAVIEGCIPLKKLLAAAHEHGATITALLIAVLMRSIADSMPVRERAKPVVITVPVNLRKYFDSKSARNFFGIINVEYNFSCQSGELADIIKHVGDSMKSYLKRDKLADRMSGLSSIENLLPARIVPVFIKDPSLKLANYIAEKSVTASFSNLGCIEMPEEFSPYIDKFGVISSTNRLQACMCSYKDKFVIGFTSPFLSTDVQCRFFRTLVNFGLEVEITSNLGGDGNVIL